MQIRRSLRPHAAALISGLLGVALMLVWAGHDGGYDADTWYWGALLLLAVLAGLLLTGVVRLPVARAARIALGGLTLYVLWSYVSIAWAASPGDALEGSNRALLYLLIFALSLTLPWIAEGALAALLVYVVGVGVIAFVLLARLASGDHVAQLIVGGRLESPTGYFNSTAALFMIDALMATALAVRRELPGPLRGLLIAIACAGVQLALIVESRGWLFTLPLVLVVSLSLVRDRFRVAAAALLPLIVTLLPLHRLLAVYKSGGGPALDHAARSAGHAALLLCLAAFVFGTVIAWAESLVTPPQLSPARRRQIGALIAALAVAAGCVGALAATKGHPVAFVQRQWNGFVHASAETTSTSNFGVVGSGRYDFWRVGLDAFLNHPLGGLGQDNFADYYVTHRRTLQEPEWAHSLEVRLLVHTGIVGFGLFGVFLVAAVLAALRARLGSDGSPEGDQRAAVAGIALLPLVVWLIHGSLDWFWEIPALSGPALGFLGAAGALGTARGRDEMPSRRVVQPRVRRVLAGVVGAVAFAAAVFVLGLPYLSVREVSLASEARQTDPARALADLASAADLDPLNAEPGRIGGTIALQTGQYGEARRRFEQAIAREPGGWYAWFGAGLAASALRQPALARRDLEMAASINPREPAIRQVLARVGSSHPFSPDAALGLLVLAQ